MKAITRWPANKMSAAYRRKRFVRAAFIRAWSRVLGVISALVVVLFFMKPTATGIAIQACYVLVAVGYLWTDVHYGAQGLRYRYKSRKSPREDRWAYLEL
ncbi:hypothetical protein ACHFCA_16550 [Delftia tsuruhatensis]